MKRLQATLVATALACTGSAALAQQSGATAGTDAQTSQRQSQDDGFPWDLLGLLGLAGLLGLRRRDDDTRHTTRP
jgi:MYXO-CTERM domain-containing protein